MIINQRMQTTTPFHSSMDFRSIPLPIPLKSPSPDCKSVNIITPTISPNVIEIKKQSTLKKNEFEKQNIKLFQEFNTHSRYYSYSTVMDQQSNNIIKEKDDIIAYLRHIINMITENSSEKNSDYDTLKSEVRILTIENEKLVNRIQKIRNRNTDDKIDEYKSTIKSLNNTIKENQTYYEQQMQQLKKYLKNANTQLTNLQSQKNSLQIENKRLLKLLLQKKQSDAKYRSLTKPPQSTQLFPTQQKNLYLIPTTKNQQKLSLMKIKQQYFENVKIVKKDLQNLIEEIFRGMNTELEGLVCKVNDLNTKLETIQKLIRNKLQKTQINTDKITISYNQTKDKPLTQVEHDQQPLFPPRKNNSQIYIEEGPQSSHEKTSRDELSRFGEEEMQSEREGKKNQGGGEGYQRNLRSLQDQQQLNKSNITSQFNPKFIKKQSQQQTSKSKSLLQQLHNKQQQLVRLRFQLSLLTQQQNKRDPLIQQQEKQLLSLKLTQENEISQMKKQTETKVKLLVENYEKQLDMLRREVMLRNTELHESKETNLVDREKTNIIISQLSTQKHTLQLQNTQLSSSIHKLQTDLLTTQQSSQKIKKTLQYQILTLHQQCDTHRKKIQQFEQQSILTLSQLNQKNIELQQLKSELEKKNQLMMEIRGELEQRQQLVEKMEQQYGKLKELLLGKDKQVETLKELMMEKEKVVEKLKELLMEKEKQGKKLIGTIKELKSSKILAQITQIQQLLQKNQQISSQQTAQLSEQNRVLYNKLAQFEKLKQQTKTLHNQLSIKQQQNMQLSAKIVQLENICQLTKNRLDQHQSQYSQLLDRFQLMEKYTTNLQLQKQELISRVRNMLDGKLLMGKIQEIRLNEEERLLHIDEMIGRDQLMGEW